MANRVIPFPGVASSRLTPLISVERRVRKEIQVADQVYVIEVKAEVTVSRVLQSPRLTPAAPDTGAAKLDRPTKKRLETVCICSRESSSPLASKVDV